MCEVKSAGRRGGEVRKWLVHGECTLEVTSFITMLYF